MITNIDREANERCSFVMSDSDDSNILADIEALDEALALTVKKKSEKYDSGQQINISDYEDFEDNEDNEDYLDYLNTNRHIDESLNPYEINTKLITGLTIAKNKLTALLEECEEKLKLLDEKMMQLNSQSNPTSKLAISNAGMPYFKDKDYYSAPKNYDTKLKEARGELFVPFLKKPSRWTGSDRETLLNAINNQAIESVLCGEFNKEVDASTSNNETRKTRLVLPRNFNEMVGPLGKREFDWHKISVMDFDNKHSPGECRAMWNIYLHPDFRKHEWTSAEDNKLLRCVREYKNQDWDAITQKLGTNRSAYQCFIRYNTIKKVPSAGYPWTRQEDKQLVKIINALRIGDFIPWPDLANHMRHRTKQQIYVRWMYRKAPHLKKGRFTSAETSTLMKAVQKYGKNFTKIANVVMPQRTSVQLQERYQTVMAKKDANANLWTQHDDMTLINLNMKYHNDWAKIATRFSNKSRTQVRHRYSALLKYIRQGISLERIPRPSARNKKDLINKKSSSGTVKLRNKINQMQNNTVQISDIQSRLYETLCFPLSVKCNNSESEEIYDIEHLVCNTKKLYNILNLLNANLDIPDDSVNYIQLNNRERQLLVSLKEHINILKNNGIPKNNELIENFRIRMFGYDSEVSKSDFFIPPLPFDGYVRTKKSQKNMSGRIDYDIDFNEKFLVDLPTEFSVTSYTLSFLNIEEEIQFHKFGQFLTNHNYNQQNVDLYKSMRCIFSFAKKSSSNEASLENNELNVNSNTSLPDSTSLNEQLNKETNSIFADEDEDMSNIILPNQATLLGLKNLFLWKLLYDSQDESRQPCESMASTGNKQNAEQTATNSLSVRTESAEYQLLRTRLLKLFKIPISLSNIILRIDGPETLFSPEEEPTKNLNSIIVSTVSKKRKLDDAKPVKLIIKINKNNNSNVPANSDSQRNSGVITQILPTVRNRRMTRQKSIKRNTRSSQNNA